MIATGEIGGDVGESGGGGDVPKGKLGACGYAFGEPRPQRVSREEGGEEAGGAEFGAGRQRAERLGSHGGPQVKTVASKDGQVVVGGGRAPFETELGGVGRRLGGPQDAREGRREAVVW